VDYAALLSAFALLFLAEMGDKTQLMAMTLAHRYKVLPVVVGTFAAFALLNLLAVLVGEGLARIVPRNAVLALAGLLFLLFAWRSWRDSAEEPTEATTIDHRRAWLTSFTLIFVAELGDKTQLAMVALAAKTGALWSVYIGGTLALWTVSLLGILVGHTLLRRIEPRRVHRAAALLFLVFGLLALGQACVGLLADQG
jgi:putative Ca2+/H+ antiporter (TMEM165/GDT1 family)